MSVSNPASCNISTAARDVLTSCITSSSLSFPSALRVSSATNGIRKSGCTNCPSPSTTITLSASPSNINPQSSPLSLTHLANCSLASANNGFGECALNSASISSFRYTAPSPSTFLASKPAAPPEQSTAKRKTALLLQNSEFFVPFFCKNFTYSPILSSSRTVPRARAHFLLYTPRTASSNAVPATGTDPLALTFNPLSPAGLCDAVIITLASNPSSAPAQYTIGVVHIPISTTSAPAPTSPSTNASRITFPVLRPSRPTSTLRASNISGSASPTLCTVWRSKSLP